MELFEKLCIHHSGLFPTQPDKMWATAANIVDFIDEKRSEK